MRGCFRFFFFGSTPGSPIGPTPRPATLPEPAEFVGASSPIDEPVNGDISFHFFILCPPN